MKKYNLLHCILLMFALLFSSGILSQSSNVRIIETSGQWHLIVNDKPYYINGAGGDKNLDILVDAGGNTIRTWGTENALTILDEAHEKGLKVMMGLWVQHERHGFDYNNEAKVKSQLENFRKEVRRLKDHPALLLWGIGNEYELNYSNTKVWAAVNDIAKMVHKEDPNHPTSTVTAGTNSEKLAFVMNQLTDIDIYGINTYADIGNVKKVIEEGNYKGPYMITEWGPTGHWEITKTMWGASVEQSSTEKASSYLNRFTENIDSQRNQCIGSFAFLWGHKQEYTSTWYGLFTEGGEPTEAIDELEYCWTGKYPKNRAPTLDKLVFNGKEDVLNMIVAPGEKYTISLTASDSNNDRLSYRWELYPESTDKKTGGDSEGKPPILTGHIKGSKSSEIVMKTPLDEGTYRLFVFVNDTEKVAYMNIPFYVEPESDEVNRIQLKKQELEPYNN